MSKYNASKIVKIELSNPDKKELRKAIKKLREYKNLLTLLSIKIDSLTLCINEIEKTLKIVDEKYAF
jgi:prefoldin subunit 5